MILGFYDIKLSQIFTVSHVLRYEEAKFVISKKKGNCERKKIGFGSDPAPPPPFWDFVPNVSRFFKVTPPLH